MAPRIDEVAGFVIRIYTHDHGPPHVHVSKDGANLRVYLDDEHPPKYAHGQMKEADERRAIQIVRARRWRYLMKWSEIDPH